MNLGVGHPLMVFLEMFPVTFAQSLIFALVTLGIMIPYRLLDLTDLTSEGSFPLGGAVCASLLLAGVHPGMATLIAIAAGSAAGSFTGFIYYRFKINSLLSGILVMTLLYSINLRILKLPTVSLNGVPTIFQGARSLSSSAGVTLIVGLLLCLLLLILTLFLKTEAGLKFRAVGNNPKMASSNGISVFRFTLFGLALANGFSALAGALIVQSQKYADAGMGFGVLINGLASLMLGEFLVKDQRLSRRLLAPVLGTLIYHQILSFVLALGFEPSDMKFFSGMTVLIILILPNLRQKKSSPWPA